MIAVNQLKFVANSLDLLSMVMEKVSPRLELTLDNVPMTIIEAQVNRFKFYFNHEICVGMTYANELYGIVREFSPNMRLEAYRLGCTLRQQGFAILISVSNFQYSVWINLRDFGSYEKAGQFPDGKRNQLSLKNSSNLASQPIVPC